MNKILFLSSIILLGVISVNAQSIRERKVRFDLQTAQYFGLNDWNRVQFASDRLPRTSSSTDLRATGNLYVINRSAGVFCDMGVGIMPAARNWVSDPAAQATATMGIPFYTKEIVSESGNNNTASAHFKMTFGIFGEIPIANKLSLSPYFGIGYMNIPAPTCDAVLKAHDSNMQYKARYQWFDGYDDITSLNYLAYRLRLVHHISPKLDLLFGLEYTWYITCADFSETYTNYFNYNIVKTVNHQGNRLNMLGFSVGISF